MCGSLSGRILCYLAYVALFNLWGLIYIDIWNDVSYDLKKICDAS